MRRIEPVLLATCGLAVLLSLRPSFAEPPKLDTARIEQYSGMKGTYDEAEGVFKLTLPRTDLSVNIGGVHMTPPMGLTCWAAFKSAGDQTMVMGDMVLRQDQVNPAISTALDNGLAVTALHNHFLWDSPKIMFMHISGMGGAESLAVAIGKVFATIQATATVSPEVPQAQIDTAHSTVDAPPLEAIFNTPAAASNGIVKFTFGRNATMHGVEVGSAMGVNTWAAFAGTDQQAVVDGDFVMLESELQNVIKALRRGGISIVAIHNHMTDETPRMIFLHYWGIGASIDLAKTVKTALDTQHMH